MRGVRGLHLILVSQSLSLSVALALTVLAAEIFLRSSILVVLVARRVYLYLASLGESP